jgi:hypothetical protein
MTDEEKLAYFEQVKGKPIRYSESITDCYFIPNMYLDSGIMRVLSYHDGEAFYEEDVSIGNGFESGMVGYRWYIDYGLLASMEIDKALKEG